MKEIFILFPDSLKVLFKDPKLRTLSLWPIFITFIIYFMLTVLFFWFVLPWAQVFLMGLIPAAISSIASWVITIAVFLLFLLLINWTFVMTISVISSPFNSLISDEIASRDQRSKKSQSLHWTKIILIEIRKVTIITLITIIVMGLGFIPFLGIISFILSAILLSISFLDYSWSRHHWSLSQGLKHYRDNFWSFTLGGIFFMTLMPLPIVNALIPIWATSYFTHLWLKKLK